MKELILITMLCLYCIPVNAQSNNFGMLYPTGHTLNIYKRYVHPELSYTIERNYYLIFVGLILAFGYIYLVFKGQNKNTQ